MNSQQVQQGVAYTQQTGQNIVSGANQAINSQQVQQGVAYTQQAGQNIASGVNQAMNSQQVQRGVAYAQQTGQNIVSGANQAMNSQQVQQGVAYTQQAGQNIVSGVNQAINSQQVQQGVAYTQQAGQNIVSGANQAMNSQQVQQGMATAQHAGAAVASGVVSGINTAAPIMNNVANQSATLAQNGAQNIVSGANQAMNSQQVQQGMATAQQAGATVASGVVSGVNTAAPILNNIANQSATLAQNGAQKTAEGVNHLYQQAVPVATEGAAAVASGAELVYTEAAPHVVKLVGDAKDCLANVKMEALEFDIGAAKSALGVASGYGVLALGAAAGAAGTIGGLLSGCSVDILKVEIVRDFFQFLGIYFSSLDFPSSFKAFYFWIASFFSASFSELTAQFKTVTPIGWFMIFFLVMMLSFGLLVSSMDLKKDLAVRMKKGKFFFFFKFFQSTMLLHNGFY